MAKRVNIIYHGETQGSCDFVTKASPCGTLFYFKYCLICDYVILNSVALFWGWKLLFFLFSFLLEVFLCVRCFPRATARTESISDVKEEQVDEDKKHRTSLFSLGIVPRKPA